MGRFSRKYFGDDKLIEILVGKYEGSGHSVDLSVERMVTLKLSFKK